MPPRSKSVDHFPRAGAGADSLVAAVDFPPAWSQKLRWIPLIGTYLNIMMQAQDYFTPLEDCVDFIARDVFAGLGSSLVGHRVAVKVKSKGT